VIFNPSPLPSHEQMRSFPWAKVNWLIVNEGEAQDLYSAFRVSHKDATPFLSNDELLAALSALPSFSTTNIICTLGKAGVLAFIPAFHRPKSIVDRPSIIGFPAAILQNPVRDTTGAGDCFTGYFVQGLMELGPNAKVGAGIQESDIARILKKCIEAAGICVERPGTIDSIPSANEVQARMAL